MKIHRPDLFDRLPDAILLDLDDTLYDYAVAHDAAMAATEAKVKQSLKITPQQIRAGYARARSEIKASLGHTAASHSRLLYFQRMIENFGLRNQVLMALDLEHTYWRTFLAASVLHEGVDAALTEFRARGVKIAIVTDLTAQIQLRKIAHFRLDRHVDCVVTSEEAGADKVSLKPFELALSKMGLDASSRLWAIGDDVGDMAAAKLSDRVATLQFRTARAKELECHASFGSFAELLAFVSSLPEDR